MVNYSFVPLSPLLYAFNVDQRTLCAHAASLDLLENPINYNLSNSNLASLFNVQIGAIQ